MFHNTIRKSMLTLIVVCFTLTGFSQVPLQRVYDYDSCGNRVCRRVVVIPVNTLRNLSQPVENTIDSCYHEKVCSCSCKIYPNPTTGQIHLDIEDLTTTFQGEAALYNANGAFLRNYKISASHNIFDFSDFPSGIYIMRLNINTKSEEWKIIKR